MSEISSRIQQYRDGGSDWPTLRDWLVSRHYVDARRNADPQPGGPLDERDWDCIYVEGSSSWDEVQESRADLQLTDAPADRQMHDRPRAVPGWSGAGGRSARHLRSGCPCARPGR